MKEIIFSAPTPGTLPVRFEDIKFKRKPLISNSQVEIQLASSPPTPPQIQLCFFCEKALHMTFPPPLPLGILKDFFFGELLYTVSIKLYRKQTGSSSIIN